MNEETTQNPTSTPTTTNEESAPVEQRTESEPVKSVLFNEGEPEAEGTTENQSEDNAEEARSEVLKAEDITIPEGVEVDAELGKSFVELLNDEKLSRKELAQKLFDLYQSQSTKLLDGLKAAEKEKTKKFTADMAAEKAEWIKQCEADKEFGGQKWESSQAVINRGCEHLATPEAVKLMQAYNLNTHPEIVRMFYRAGLLAGEDKSETAGTGNTKPNDPAMAIFGESLKEYHKRKGEMQ